MGAVTPFDESIIENLSPPHPEISPQNPSLFRTTPRHSPPTLPIMPIFALLLVFLWLPATGGAEQTDDVVPSALPDVRDFVADKINAPATRVEVEVGKLDPRLKLKPCATIEPFVPPGTRFWGRGHIGMRCAQPGGWTVYLPIHVRVYASIPIAARPLSAGTVLTNADIAAAEHDITRPGYGAIPSREQLVGRSLIRAFAPGQPILQSALKPAPIIANGDTVQLVAQGDGFSVNSTGVALSQAEEGQRVRVKSASGKIVTGIARPGKRVDIEVP